MLKISPEKREFIYLPLLKKNGCDNDCTCLTAFENGVFLGYIIVKEEKTSLTIKGFEMMDCKDYIHLDSLYSQLAQLLIRAAGNFAFNRGILKMTGDLDSLFFVCTALNLNDGEDSVEIDIKKLFKPCEHKS